jgi:hypothetical protein
LSATAMGLENAPISDRYQHLVEIITSEHFLKMRGIGKEVPFYICPYKPEDSIEMFRMQKQLVHTLENKGIQLLWINLYDLAIEILKDRGIFDRVIDIEQSKSKAEFLELLQGVLDPETHLVPKIVEKMDETEFDVMIISGVGQVFPYIRSHNVLNNLQKVATKHPTLMFFPGVYTHSLEKGVYLDLFGRLHDDKYYRAFNIYHCAINTQDCKT